MLDHLPLPRNELQRLGHVLADLAQSAIAAARAGRGYRIDDAFARQVLGQRTRAGLRRSNDGTAIFSAAAAGLCSILFQVGELKLQLIEQRATFRGWPKLFVPQLVDRILELLDQQRAVVCFASAAMRAARSAMSIDFSVSTSLGKESSAFIANDGITRCCARVEPVIDCGFTMPRSAGGKRSPRLLRHAPIDAFEQIAKLRRRNRHHPVGRRRPGSGLAPAASRTDTFCPSCHSTLISPPRRPRNTNRCPLCGSRLSVSCTMSAKPSNPCACRCGRPPARPARRSGPGSSPPLASPAPSSALHRPSIDRPGDPHPAASRQLDLDDTGRLR